MDFRLLSFGCWVDWAFVFVFVFVCYWTLDGCLYIFWVGRSIGV